MSSKGGLCWPFFPFLCEKDIIMHQSFVAIEFTLLPFFPPLSLNS